MKTIAIIPARGGSKGVPKKNIKLLGGYPLIAYSIAAAALSKKIERVVVSTDSDEIAQISRRFGADVPFLRPKEFSTDTSPDIDFVMHAINWFRENEENIPELIVHMRPTTPLRDPSLIDQAINKILSNSQATSLRSGHPASESPFKWFILDKNEYFRSISPEYSNEDINKPRQFFPTVYIPDGYVDIIKASFVIKENILHGDKMLGFISPFCVEVDTIQDFELLEFELEKKGNPILDYLRKNYGKMEV